MPRLLENPAARVRTSEEWTAYFVANRERQLPIPWEIGADVSDEELRPIVASLQAWQLGETSDGSHLLAAAKQYAMKVGDPEFIECVRLFIAEEQRHGASLGRFLDLAGAPRVCRNWGDTLFRRIRYCVQNMEIWATPVVMVETHALIYYHALYRATSSRVLKGICRQILRDEIPHIRLQCERLAILHRERGAFALWLTLAFHRVFFAIITIAVWIGHRRAVSAGGYRFHSFWRSAWFKMNRAWNLMQTLRKDAQP